MKAAYLLTLLIAMTSCTNYSGPYSRNYEANQKLLLALKNNGANLSKLHSIEHHFDCTTKQCFEQTIKLGKLAGYEVKYEGETEQKTWVLDLVKSSIPDVKLIENQCIEMESIEEKTGAHYDGWGTEIEK
jgi:regulator of ribonuclease activity B